MVGEPQLHVVQRRCRQIFKATDCIVVVGVTDGEQRFRPLIVNQPKRLIIALTLFIGYNADLVIQLFLGQAIEQIAHAVAFQK